MSGPGWATTNTYRAAGGRRRINAERQAVMRERQAEIRRYLLASDTYLVTRGTQRALAVRFNVSEATMSRDVRAIMQAQTGGLHKCFACGAKAVSPLGLAAIEAGLDRVDTLIAG